MVIKQVDRYLSYYDSLQIPSQYFEEESINYIISINFAFPAQAVSAFVSGDDFDTCYESMTIGTQLLNSLKSERIIYQCRLQAACCMQVLYSRYLHQGGRDSCSSKNTYVLPQKLPIIRTELIILFAQTPHGRHVAQSPKRLEYTVGTCSMRQVKLGVSRNVF